MSWWDFTEDPGQERDDAIDNPEQSDEEIDDWDDTSDTEWTNEDDIITTEEETGIPEEGIQIIDPDKTEEQL